MENLPQYHGWFARRYWRALIVGVALLSFARSDARAAWISFPFSQKSESGPSRQSGQGGYPVVIRRLLEEAKTLEEAGSFDRAIVLAERAHRLSLSSPSIRKQDPELAPELLAKYSYELRLKKVEYNIQRMAASGRGQRQSKQRQQQSPESEPSTPSTFADNSIPPAPSSVIVPRTYTKAGDSRIAARVSPPPPVASLAGTQVQAVSSINRGSKQAVVTIGFDKNDKQNSNLPPAPQSANIDYDFDPFAIKDENKSARPVTTETPESVTESSPVEELIVADTTNQDPVAAPDETSATIIEQEIRTPESEPQTFSKSTQIKLRRRFETDEPILATLSDDAGSRSKLTEPKITPRSNPPFEPKVIQEPGRIVDEFQETVLDSQSAVSGQVDSDRPSKELNDRSDRALDEVQDSEFPADKVIALKRKLDSAIALKPGEIVGGLTTEPMANSSWDQTPEEKKIENRKVRLRKHQRKKLDLHSNLAEQLGKIFANQSVIGQTSLIQWRSAKDDEKATFTSEKFEAKSSQLQSDLRDSLRAASSNFREISPNSKEPSLFSLPKAEVAGATPTDRKGRTEQGMNSQNQHHSNNRTQIRGSLWDNASAPSSLAGFSGTIGGSGKLMDPQSGEPGFAPKPPTDPMVEQISFDKPAELFSRRTSAMGASTQNVDQDEQHVDAEDRSRTIDQNGLTGDHKPAAWSISAYSPFAWPSLVFGAPMSTGTSIFGAAGVALLIAGVWVARETIRSRNS